LRRAGVRDTRCYLLAGMEVARHLGMEQVVKQVNRRAEHRRASVRMQAAQIRRDLVASSRRTSSGRPSRPRERRAIRRAGTRSSAGADPDREPPLSRVCRGCGRDFETREPRRRYCDEQCKWRSQKTSQRGTDLADDLLGGYRAKVVEALHAGELEGDDALVLLSHTPAEARARLTSPFPSSPRSTSPIT
jgi:hypothetical protein